MTSQAEPQQSTFLPLRVREELQKAAKIADDVERQRRIDEIIDRAKRNYPKFFKQHP